jgi:hypothetical protein
MFLCTSILMFNFLDRPWEEKGCWIECSISSIGKLKYLTAWVSVLPEKLIVVQLVKNAVPVSQMNPVHTVTPTLPLRTILIHGSSLWDRSGVSDHTALLVWPVLVLFSKTAYCLSLNSLTTSVKCWLSSCFTGTVWQTRHQQYCYRWYTCVF